MIFPRAKRACGYQKMQFIFFLAPRATQLALAQELDDGIVDKRTFMDKAKIHDAIV